MRTWLRVEHDYVIAKMKQEDIEKQNKAAIRLANQKKKQKDLDELEENMKKRFAEATLQHFGLLDAVSEGIQSGNQKQLQVLEAKWEIKNPPGPG